MDTEQNIFDENYKRTLSKLEESLKTPGFSADTVKGELEALYRYEGLDWTGRGALKQAEISGAILAYQVFLKNLASEG